MSSNLLEVKVRITELHSLVEKKIKTDRLKQHSRTDVIPYQWPILGLSKFPNLYVYNSLIAPSK